MYLEEVKPYFILNSPIFDTGWWGQCRIRISVRICYAATGYIFDFLDLMQVKVLLQYSHIYPKSSTDESLYWKSNIPITSDTENNIVMWNCTGPATHVCYKCVANAPLIVTEWPECSPGALKCTHSKQCILSLVGISQVIFLTPTIYLIW